MRRLFKGLIRREVSGGMSFSHSLTIGSCLSPKNLSSSVFSSRWVTIFRMNTVAWVNDGGRGCGKGGKG